MIVTGGSRVAITPPACRIPTEYPAVGKTSLAKCRTSGTSTKVIDNPQKAGNAIERLEGRKGPMRMAAGQRPETADADGAARTTKNPQIPPRPSRKVAISEIIFEFQWGIAGNCGDSGGPQSSVSVSLEADFVPRSASRVASRSNPGQSPPRRAGRSPRPVAFTRARPLTPRPGRHHPEPVASTRTGHLTPAGDFTPARFAPLVEKRRNRRPPSPA